VRSLKLDREWWRIVRYAMGEERRTARLVSILVTVGVIMAVLDPEVQRILRDSRLRPAPGERVHLVEPRTAHHQPPHDEQ